MRKLSFLFCFVLFLLASASVPHVDENYRLKISELIDDTHKLNDKISTLRNETLPDKLALCIYRRDKYLRIFGPESLSGLFSSYRGADSSCSDWREGYKQIIDREESCDNYCSFIEQVQCQNSNSIKRYNYLNAAYWRLRYSNCIIKEKLEEK